MKSKESENMIRFESKAIRDCVYSGVIHGIWSWTIYSIVECWFACILPWIIKPNYDYVPLHWGFTVLLFFLYPAIGSILGGLYGLVFHLAISRIRFLQRIKTTILFQMAATFTVVFAFRCVLFSTEITSCT